MERKASKKQPPAYQTYASDLMADRRYRLMSLEERGLFFSIQNECWVNASVPSGLDSLGKLLGFSETEISPALTERVTSFFDEDSGQFRSPELDKYKLHLDQIRDKQSAGGRKGVQAKRDKELDVQGLPSGTPQGRRVEKNRAEQRKTEPLGRGEISDPWLDAYNKESNGG